MSVAGMDQTESSQQHTSTGQNILMDLTLIMPLLTLPPASKKYVTVFITSQISHASLYYL